MQSADLEIGRRAQMSVVPNAAIFAAGSHDQTDAPCVWVHPDDDGRRYTRRPGAVLLSRSAAGRALCLHAPRSPQLCLRATTERRCGHQFDCGRDQSLVVVSILADIRGSKGDRDMGRKWLELVGQYKCECGAIYKQIATQTPFTDTDYADCEVCGARMDSWRNSTSSRSYELLSRPE